MSAVADDLKAELQKHASDDDAASLQRFFKTGKGQYGEGDVFIGVRVPKIRAACKRFRDLPLDEVQKLLDSPVHEHRLAAVILLADNYPKAGYQRQQAIYELYLKNVRRGRINNWDIIDISTPKVVGAYLHSRPRQVLYEMARSDDIWQKRTAVLATFWFIREGDASTTLDIARILLHDKHDLIQKAVGWMLREAGKQDERTLTGFLDKYAAEMPRTMLRYAVERLPLYLQKQYKESV